MEQWQAPQEVGGKAPVPPPALGMLELLEELDLEHMSDGSSPATKPGCRAGDMSAVRDRGGLRV